MNKYQILHLTAVIVSAITSAVIGFFSGADPLVTGTLGAGMNSLVTFSTKV